MVKIELIESLEAFENLKASWQALSQRAAQSRFSQSYEWCRAGWTHRSEGERAKLKCLTLWQGDLLVGVWAFKCVRKGLAVHMMPLGMGLGGEYAEPLLDEAVNTLEICHRLLGVLKKHCDVVNLHFLRHDSILCEAARAYGRPRINYKDEAFAIDPTGAANWDAFMGSYSKNMRMQMRRSMNRLLAMGRVELVLAETEAQAREISDWLLEQKRHWLEVRHIKLDWFYQDSSAAFLRQLALTKGPNGRGALFGLKLNGTLIAASVNTVDKFRVEGMILTFDTAYAHYSPGMLILQETTRWAYERGLEHDLRVLSVDYKQRWATYTVKHDTFLFGMTALGGLVVAIEWGEHFVRDQIKTRLSPEALKTLKAVIRGQWRRPAPATEAPAPDAEAMPEAA